MSKDAHRVTLDQLGEFITQLGIDWDPRSLRGIVIEPGKITVTRNRHNEQGHSYVLPGTDEVATETVTIAVVNPPAVGIRATGSATIAEVKA